MSRPNIYIYQIFYDEASKSKLQKGFVPLDNSTNTRPDWAEYWPIRNVLLNKSYSSDDYIGFFSPKFYSKTGCTSEYVLDCVSSAKHSIYSFSPFFDEMALYFNSFEQGERFHKGIYKAGNLFLKTIGAKFELGNIVSDCSTCIFSNYFVAKYDFWKIWFSWTEKLFQIAEVKDGELARLIGNYTMYQGKYNTHFLKVFLVERLVTLVLASWNLQAAYMLDVDKIPLTLAAAKYLGEFLACDALKGQYLKTNKITYLKEFQNIRNRVLKTLNSSVHES